MKPTREFTVVIEEDDEGFLVAEVPELRSCYTQARSLDELMVRIREAIAVCMEEEPAQAGRLRFVGVQRVTL